MKKFAILLLCGLLAMFSLTGCDVLLNSLLGDNGGVSYAEPTDDFIADFELITLAPTQSNAPSDAPASKTPTPTANPTEEPDEPELDYYGVYTSRDDVALYIFLYGELPSNFITKAEARALGWNGGSLEPYAPGKCIGGDRFGNYEGLLPEKNGRIYTECDIDTLGASKRGAKRIVFSNDGLIYYTDDHYESFILLYGDENQ